MRSPPDERQEPDEADAAVVANRDPLIQVSTCTPSKMTTKPRRANAFSTRAICVSTPGRRGDPVSPGSGAKTRFFPFRACSTSPETTNQAASLCFYCS